LSALFPQDGTSYPEKRFFQEYNLKGRALRDIASTATFIATIAIVIVLILMAPKSFGFETSHPIVDGDLPAQK